MNDSPNSKKSGSKKKTGLDRAAVLALIRDHQTWGKREIARELRLAAHEKQELKGLLHKLETEGAVERRGRHGYAIAGEVPNVSVVEFSHHDSEGDLVGRIAGHEEDPSSPLIRLVEERGRKAPHPLGVGERALCRLSKAEDGVYEARVIKTLGRQRPKLLGVVRSSPHGKRIESVERGAREPYLLKGPDAKDLDDGDLVVFAVDAERRSGMKTARIVEEIGREDGPHAPTLLAIHEHGIEDAFDDHEMSEVAALVETTPKGRADLTTTPLVTIDPVDARDHDDAVWAAPDEDARNLGGWVVVVAVADVAAYVRPGTALDRGAERRGVSVYFPDRVAPMLPERLSNDLCSLREDEPRPCLAVRMIFNKDGDKVTHAFVRGWMRSAAKLSYEQAQAAIDGKPDEKTGPLLDPVLKPLWAAYAAVKAARERRSPLEIEAPERKILLDEKGRVTGVIRRERFDAHKLIEEFMIQANVAAAETLERKKRVVVYRIHEEPAPERIDALTDFLPQVGLKWSKGERPTPKRFNALLERARKTEHAEVVNEVVLRTQSQAVYSTENVGHFGLNLDRYAHFTSPIRRYADLAVHRALIESLGFGADGTRKEDEVRLPGVAERISQAERKAMAAERDAGDRYLSAYLADRVGGVFKARITGVTRAGCFVRLSETGADGLAPASRLGQEYFVHDAAAQALVGRDTGARFRLGMPVEVRLVEAAPIQGGLLFDILTDPEPGPRPSRRGMHRGGPPRRQSRRGRRR
jgi:ribonuclease R